MEATQQIHTDGYARLHTCRNPFGSATFEELAALMVSDVAIAPLVERLRRPPAAARVAIEFVGPCGHGKSTHLTALWTHFRKLPRTLLRPDETAPRIPRAPIVFLDESQRLPAWRRRWLFRRRAHFVLATHVSHREEFEAAGIEDVVHHRVGALEPDAFRARLEAFVQRRMRWAALGTGPTPDVPAELLDALVRQHGQHLRATQDALYDWFQALVRAGTDRRFDEDGVGCGEQ